MAFTSSSAAAVLHTGCHLDNLFSLPACNMTGEKWSMAQWPGHWSGNQNLHLFLKLCFSCMWPCRKYFTPLSLLFVLRLFRSPIIIIQVILHRDQPSVFKNFYTKKKAASNYHEEQILWKGNNESKNFSPGMYVGIKIWSHISQVLL